MRHQSYLYCHVPYCNSLVPIAHTASILCNAAHSRWSLPFEEIVLVRTLRVQSISKTRDILHLSWHEAQAVPVLHAVILLPHPKVYYGLRSQRRRRWCSFSRIILRTFYIESLTTLPEAWFRLFRRSNQQRDDLITMNTITSTFSPTRRKPMRRHNIM